MSLSVQHIHLKTPDPKKTIQYYIDNFGATLKGEMGKNGYQLDLHGIQLNVTIKIPEQNHAQNYGIEHLGVGTDDYPGTMAKLRANGVEVLEEVTGSTGRRVAFVAAPDGAQMEIIELA